MAFSTTSKKPLSLLAFITIHLLLQMVNSQETIHIFFNGFDPKSGNLIRQGDATISSSEVLQLTGVDNRGNPLGGSVGRALYSQPVPLYDKSTGKVSSISTSFVFKISTPSRTPADGLAFFLASPGTTIPPNSGGGFLGLFSRSNARNNSGNELIGFKASSDRVVAIEFDTYSNRELGDPNFRHIGIDVNSIRSAVTRQWEWQNGQIVNANVRYDPRAKTLRVIASSGRQRVDFTHQIDLTTVLPERVRVGFSGSTGRYSQLNNVLSWTYISRLENVNVAEEGGIASVV